MMKVYMDNAATTALSSEVLNAMMPYLTDIYGNASSVHSFGQDAKKGVDKAREQVAQAINAAFDEIIFTGSGTEADNIAIKGAAFKNEKKGKHIITTTVEHHAVLHTCEELARKGFDITYLPVDEYGMITPKQVEDALRDDTILVTVMFANNEVGSIMPIEEIGRICHDRKILFHTDAVQAVTHVPIDVKEMHIDMLSLSAHKFHGPKGVGALYVRKGVAITPVIVGGAHERGRRAGTENVAGIVGLGTAIELAMSNMDRDMVRIKGMRDRLIAEIPKRIDEVKLNGHPTKRLPGNVNFSIKYIEGEACLLYTSDAADD